jgi:asparagine synthetase B (glutamine-hydrolysing)
MEAYLRVFRQAMGRRAPKHPAIVPLSGGRDSRHILFELLAQGHRPELCITHEHFPPRHNEDVRIARLVAEAAGVRHRTVRQARSRLRAEIRKNLETGFCTDEGAQLLTLARSLEGMPGTTLYDGIGGDVLSAGLFLDPESHAAMTTGDFTALARRLTKKRQQQLEFVLRPTALSRFGWDLAVERTAEELARHAKAPNPVGSFFFWNRTRREIALGPYQILSGEVLAPYLDHDVYDLLSATPADILIDRTFHTDVIARGYPQFANLPFEDSSVSKGGATWFYRQFAAELAGYLLLSPGYGLFRLPDIVLRLLRCAVVGDFHAIDWMDPVLLTYMSGLQRLSGDAAILGTAT